MSSRERADSVLICDHASRSNSASGRLPRRRRNPTRADSFRALDLTVLLHLARASQLTAHAQSLSNELVGTFR